jgi:hypothetical protein
MCRYIYHWPFLSAVTGPPYIHLTFSRTRIHTPNNNPDVCAGTELRERRRGFIPGRKILEGVIFVIINNLFDIFNFVFFFYFAYSGPCKSIAA